MNAPLADAPTYTFSFPTLDTLLQVEETGDSVTIRASRDTFSEARRQRFVRELAAEGFIPDEYRWCGAPTADAAGVRWVVDTSCFLPGPAETAKTLRFMLRLLGAAAFFWLVMMGLLFLCGGR